MPEFCTIQVSPEQLDQPEYLKRRLARALSVPSNRIQHHRLYRRSIDARKRTPKFVLRYQVWVDEAVEIPTRSEPIMQNVAHASPVIVIGAGPAGLFAALELIAQGCRPIVLERGKAVRERRRDLVQITRHGIVHPDSNYCFGEGGAGTFSDGKLYTRSKKRGNVLKVLEHLVYFGASPEILIDAHPHIGTNKLPSIIEQMRNFISSCGGEIRFSTRVTDFVIKEGHIQGVKTQENQVISAPAVILATGHSARDIYYCFDRLNLSLEAKAFALGVRVEHPQSLIDQIQYHTQGVRHKNLPAAPYSLVNQVRGQGVYSFCMCPGGIICPAATGPGEVVVNGWSPSKRNSPYANSGIVVELKLDVLPHSSNPVMSALAYQEAIEQKAFEAGGSSLHAPAQALADFVAGKFSSNLPTCSYRPGLTSAQLSEVLPTAIYQRLRDGFKRFDKRLKGYLSNDAVAVGVESRTSAPLRIPRSPVSLMHPDAQGLFPCGEGAGYAGGIMSAAIDGQKCAQSAQVFLNRA